MMMWYTHRRYLMEKKVICGGEFKFTPNGFCRAKGFLGVYLQAIRTDGHKINETEVKFEIFLINSKDNKKSIIHEIMNKLNGDIDPWGFHRFIRLESYRDLSEGYIDSDSGTIYAFIRCLKLLS